MSAKIIVHEKALGHLSKGLYRSPASAVRELISNAWDANATAVHVDTNCPNFARLSVSDNGHGFSKAEFTRLMSGNIGNSEKRVEPLQMIHRRPTIGRLGIGMLGIAQVCPSFIVKSRPKKGEPFAARVVLFEELKERLDKQRPASGSAVQVGTYDFIDDPLDDRKHGTLIYSDEMNVAFIRGFSAPFRTNDVARPPRDWADFLKEVGKANSLRQLGDYWRFVWELAATTPVPYLDNEAIPDEMIEKDQIKLVGYDFNVVVDDISLRKPVYLSGNPNGYTTVPLKLVEKVYGNDVALHGYVAVQEGKQLQPDELRGVLVRIKNIGVGTYDTTLLDYRSNEGPRSRWVTGEIYVDKGLEDALNIDRDSFNRFHPEFMAVQEYLHEVLRKEVFRVVYQKLDARSKRKKAAKETKRRLMASDVLQSAKTELKATLPATDHRPVTTKPTAIPDSVRVRQSQTDLVSSILTIFDMAVRIEDPEKRRAFFIRTIADLLKRW